MDEPAFEARCAQTFDKIDKNGDGSITYMEFMRWYKNAGKENGVRMTDKVLNETRMNFNKFDVDGSGSIDREELIGLVAALKLEEFLDEAPADMHELPPLEAIHQAFAMLDLNSNGYLNRTEINSLLAEVNSHWTNEELGEAFEYLDHNGDGQIDFDEFHEFWKSKWDKSHKLHNTEASSKRGAVKLSAHMGAWATLNSPTLLPVPPEPEFRDAFVYLDIDKNRYVSREELDDLLRAVNSTWDDDELQQAFEYLDYNKDGRISFEEFHGFWQAKWDQSHPLNHSDAAQADGAKKLNDNIGNWAAAHIPGIAYHPDRYVDPDEMFRRRVKATFHQIDKNRDENITYMEFLKWWKAESKKLGKPFDDATLMESRNRFNEYDTNGNGTIDRDELCGLIRALDLSALLAEAEEEPIQSGKVWKQDKKPDTIVLDVRDVPRTAKNSDSAVTKAASSILAPVTKKMFRTQTTQSIAENPDVLAIVEQLMDGEELDEANAAVLKGLVASLPGSTVQAVDFILEVLRADRGDFDDEGYAAAWEEFKHVAVQKGCDQKEIDVMKVLVPSKGEIGSMDIVDVGFILAKVLSVPEDVVDGIQDGSAASNSGKDDSVADTHQDITASLLIDCEHDLFDMASLQGPHTMSQLSDGICSYLDTDRSHVRIFDGGEADGKKCIKFEMHELNAKEVTKMLEILKTDDSNAMLVEKVNLAGTHLTLLSDDLELQHVGTRSALSTVAGINEGIDVVEGYLDVRVLQANGLLSEWQSVYCTLENLFCVFSSHDVHSEDTKSKKKGWNIFKRKKLPRPIPLQGSSSSSTEGLIEVTSSNGTHHLKATTGAENQYWAEQLAHSIAKANESYITSDTESVKVMNPMLDQALSSAQDGTLAMVDTLHKENEERRQAQEREHQRELEKAKQQKEKLEREAKRVAAELAAMQDAARVAREELARTKYDAMMKAEEEVKQRVAREEQLAEATAAREAEIVNMKAELEEKIRAEAEAAAKASNDTHRAEMNRIQEEARREAAATVEATKKDIEARLKEEREAKARHEEELKIEAAKRELELEQARKTIEEELRKEAAARAALLESQHKAELARIKADAEAARNEAERAATLAAAQGDEARKLIEERTREADELKKVHKTHIERLRLESEVAAAAHNQAMEDSEQKAAQIAAQKASHEAELGKIKQEAEAAVLSQREAQMEAEENAGRAEELRVMHELELSRVKHEAEHAAALQRQELEEQARAREIQERVLRETFEADHKRLQEEILRASAAENEAAKREAQRLQEELEMTRKADLEALKEEAKRVQSVQERARKHADATEAEIKKLKAEHEAELRRVKEDAQRAASHQEDARKLVELRAKNAEDVNLAHNAELQKARAEADRMAEAQRKALHESEMKAKAEADLIAAHEEEMRRVKLEADRIQSSEIQAHATEARQHAEAAEKQARYKEADLKRIAQEEHAKRQMALNKKRKELLAKHTLETEASSAAALAAHNAEIMAIRAEAEKRKAARAALEQKKQDAQKKREQFVRKVREEKLKRLEEGVDRLEQFAQQKRGAQQARASAFEQQRKNELLQQKRQVDQEKLRAQQEMQAAVEEEKRRWEQDVLELKLEQQRYIQEMQETQRKVKVTQNNISRVQAQSTAANAAMAAGAESISRLPIRAPRPASNGEIFMLKFAFKLSELVPIASSFGVPIAPNPFIVMFRDDGFGGWIPFLCSRHFMHQYECVFRGKVTAMKACECDYARTVRVGVYSFSKSHEKGAGKHKRHDIAHFQELGYVDLPLARGNGTGALAEIGKRTGEEFGIKGYRDRYEVQQREDKGNVEQLRGRRTHSGLLVLKEMRLLKEIKSSQNDNLTITKASGDVYEHFNIDGLFGNWNHEDCSYHEHLFNTTNALKTITEGHKNDCEQTVLGLSHEAWEWIVATATLMALFYCCFGKMGYGPK